MVLHGIALHRIISYGIAWYCIVWYVIVLHGIALYLMILHGVALLASARAVSRKTPTYFIIKLLVAGVLRGRRPPPTTIVAGPAFWEKSLFVFDRVEFLVLS